MNLSRRGFLLGASTVGALAILPIPLLKVVEAPVINLQGTITGRHCANLKFIGDGELTRTAIADKRTGLYFASKFIPTQDLQLSIRQPFIENTSVGDMYRTYAPIGLLDIELEANRVSIQDDFDDPFWRNFGESIKIDFASGGARYSGNFIISEYTLHGGS